MLTINKIQLPLVAVAQGQETFVDTPTGISSDSTLTLRQIKRPSFCAFWIEELKKLIVFIATCFGLCSKKQKKDLDFSREDIAPAQEMPLKKIDPPKVEVAKAIPIPKRPTPALKPKPVFVKKSLPSLPQATKKKIPPPIVTKTPLKATNPPKPILIKKPSPPPTMHSGAQGHRRRVSFKNVDSPMSSSIVTPHGQKVRLDQSYDRAQKSYVRVASLVDGLMLARDRRSNKLMNKTISFSHYSPARQQTLLKDFQANPEHVIYVHLRLRKAALIERDILYFYKLVTDEKENHGQVLLAFDRLFENKEMLAPLCKNLANALPKLNSLRRVEKFIRAHPKHPVLKQVCLHLGAT